MKKKILAFVLLAALLLNALPVYAANAPTFRVDSVTAEAGDTVEVTIWIDNNPGLASAKLVASFGSELTLTGVSFNAGLGGMSQPPQTLSSPVILNWLNFMDNTNGDMYFAKLTFAVAEGAVAGTYPITVTYDPDDVYNIDYDNIDFEVVNGGVTIEGEEEELPVSVTGVALDKETLSLIEGETAVLTATVSPADAANKEVTFVSENPAVATVDGTGKVTAMKAGTTTITVNTVDGGFTADCVVTVACAHSSKTTTPAKDSDCTNKGWDTYKTCDGCGQLFNAADEAISEVPFRPLSDTHTGGTATCTQLAVCTACGAEYGALALHNYSAEVKSEETLIEAGTCGSEAVYFYSCSVCGEVEGNENHTFLGEKDPENHVGGTTLVGKREPNHPEQISGYTGDEVCNGCGEVLVWGDEIFAGYHIAGGPLHYDEDFHWYECILDGCTAMQEITFHTPDHEGGATEEYAIKCVECGYVMEEQLDHTHEFKEIVDDQFLVSSADCENAAVYHVSCACGKSGEATFEHGAPKGHKWQDATCEFPKTCSVCLKTEGEARGHKWEDATCVRPQTCAVCLKTEGDALGHKWIEATCDAPKTCDRCGATEGEKLEHKWVEATCDKARHCQLCGATDGEALGHKWVDADCETAKTCEVCGKTEGEALGHKPDRDEPTEEDAVKCTVCGEILVPALGHTHKTEKVAAKDATCTEAGNKAYYVCKCGLWFSDAAAKKEIKDHNSVVIAALGHKWKDATCEAPKTCKVCGETEGEPAEHNWKDATCTAPKTCKACGLTEGEALGHGETVQKSNKKQHWLACSVCGEKIADTAANHVDENGDEKCDHCDYVMVKPGNPQTGDGALSLISLTMTLSLLGASLLVLEKKKRA